MFRQLSLMILYVKRFPLIIRTMGQKLKISSEKFGSEGKNAYLCSVRTLVLTTPLSAGSKALSILLHFE